MNQKRTGKFIMKKRKDKSLSQEQLANKLEVSERTVAKWENGDLMPKYDIVEKLCKVLGITLTQLLSGNEKNENSDKQMMFMYEKIQRQEIEKTTFTGIFLIIFGIASFCLSQLFVGSNVQDFMRGLLVGVSVAEMLVGVYVVATTFSK